MSKYDKCDFSGYATKYNIKCNDGKTIMQDAFSHQDGQKVSIVYQHNHKDLDKVLGHAFLESRKDGIYAYGFLGNDDEGNKARSKVQHGDLDSLSIYANDLDVQNGKVYNGRIRELSLVLSGANPGARIDNVAIAHGSDGTYEELPDEAIIHSGMAIDYVTGSTTTTENNENHQNDSVEHSSDSDKKESKKDTNPEGEKKMENENKKEENGKKDKTVKEVIDTLNEEQKTAVEYLVGLAVENAKKGKKDDNVKQSGIDDEGDDNAANTDNVEHAGDKDKTVKEVIDSLTKEQRTAVEYLIGLAVENAKKGNLKQSGIEGDDMYNMFENDEGNQNNEKVMSHDAFCNEMKAARENGSASLRAHLEHAGIKDIEDNSEIYHGSITNIANFNPEPKFVQTPGALYDRDMGWVDKFLGKIKKAPFGNIKSGFVNVTGDEARAKGYVTGNQKVSEVIAAIKRSTTPTTVYKKLDVDRDSLIDLENNFDAIPFIKGEMRSMWNEEVARAALVGDQRESSSNDKIDETKVRPIYTDVDTYTIRDKASYTAATTADTIAKDLIDRAILSRKYYKGSGNPWMFMTQDMLARMILIKDDLGRRIYNNEDELMKAMRVSAIIECPVMDNLSRTVTESSAEVEYLLDGILVNPIDYCIGLPEMGKQTLLSDFDIKYNLQQYLYEGRMSGAMVVPKAAIVFEHKVVTA